MWVEGDTLLGSSAKIKQKRSNVCTSTANHSSAPDWGGRLPGMRENPAVLRFEKLLLDEVLLV